MADVFISYKKKDRPLVEALVSDLEAEGFTVWWDYEIDSGEDWLNRILKEVDLARCVVGVWTRAAVSPNGTFVPSEGTNVNYVRIEHERGARKLAPALCEAGTTLPVQFADLQTADLRDRLPGDRKHRGFRGLVERIEGFATPSWVQTRLSGLEAKLAQEQSRSVSVESRAQAVEAQMKSAAEVQTLERAELESKLAQEKSRSIEAEKRAQALEVEMDSAARALTEERVELQKLAQEKRRSIDAELRLLLLEAELQTAEGALNKGRADWLSRRVAISACAALLVGALAGWALKPETRVFVGPKTPAGPSATDLKGTWGGGDFPCASLPVRLKIAGDDLMLAIGGPPVREAVRKANDRGWFVSAGSGG